MRFLRAPARLAVLMLAACGGGGEAVMTPAPARLTIAECLAPDVVSEMRSFQVEVRIDDPLGIESLEVTFDGRPQVLPASGQRTERFLVEITPARAGTLLLDVVAIGVDGTRGVPLQTPVAVTGFPLTDTSLLDRATLADRIATWEREGRTDEEAYPRGPQYAPSNAPAAFPVVQNWWLEWVEQGGPQPFLWAELCPGATGVTPGGEVLECWLAQHPEVTQKIYWVNVDLDTGLPLVMPYATWSTSMKEDLYATFFYTYTWLESSLKTPLAIPPDPSINMIPSTASWYSVALNRQQAWVLYTATVAHCLALEIGGFVPWSILDYHEDDLRHLLSSSALFRAKEYNLSDFTYTGYWLPGILHAFPKTSFQFFVDQNIIALNHYVTIARLLRWSGQHLQHYASLNGDTDGKTAMEIAYMHWQYHGVNPVQRMLAGTQRDNWNGIRHWTRGCSGTSRLYSSILRALNIPAYWLHGDGDPDEPLLGGHTVPVFPTIGQSLSHGDDVLHWEKFTQGVSSPPSALPSTMLFVDWATFVDWFWTNPDQNVGRRRHHEIPIDVLPDDVLDLYCDDLSSGVPPGQSLIYDRFSKHYTVQGLTARGLWTRLAQKETVLDYCD
jgi:hypothetical protein